jgi:hypothetical protein
MPTAFKTCKCCGHRLATRGDYCRVCNSERPCPGCMGFGRLTKAGIPSIDRRDRKCAKCGGMGMVRPRDLPKERKT